MTHGIFNQTIMVINPGQKKTPYSTEPVDDWDNPVTFIVDFPVSIQPASSSEGPVERPQVVTTWRLYTPPGTDIPELSARSRVRIGAGLTLDVVGDPQRWPDPYNPGVVHHLEASLEQVRG